MKIEVEITYYDYPDIDEDQRYIAEIKKGEYAKTIVSAGSIAECFKELGISIFVIDDYRKNNP